MFFKKNNSTVSGAFDFMIVGLGNPGKKYEFTRHNTGFLCIDYLANENNVKIDRLKFKSLIGEVRLSGKRCLLVKPQTFMNLSGEAVRDVAEFYKIPPERILVIFDDISLDEGRMRIRKKGSDGGHNGIKNIIFHLASDEFPRIKVGVGAKPHPDYDLADWVLSTYTNDQLKTLRQVAQKVTAAAELIVSGKTDEAMSRYNG